MNMFCKVEKELLLFDYYNDISEGNYYISKDALAVMVCIGVNSHGNETMFISYNYLEYLMFKEYKRYDTQCKIIKNGFNELVNVGKIKIIHDLGKGEYVCDISGIVNNKSNNFIKITYDEFHKIMNIDTTIDQTRLLRYYACLLATFKEYKGKDYSFKIGIERQENIALMNLMGLPTVLKYNEVLKKNKIIYICKRKRYNESNVKSGKLYNQLSNVYSRYEDGEKYCSEFMDDNDFRKMNDKFINITNEMRSLSQKYNYFKRTYENTICEDIEKVMCAYNAAKQWNEYAKQDYENAIENGKHPDEPEYKDLSIFDKYDLTV